MNLLKGKCKVKSNVWWIGMVNTVSHIYPKFPIEFKGGFNWNPQNSLWIYPLNALTDTQSITFNLKDLNSNGRYFNP